MTTFLIIIHVIVCVFLIFIVLVQGGKGAEMGAAFGGSSQTLFGSRGASTFLSKLTTAMAVVFMLTSLVLAISASRGTSIIKQVPQAPAPAVPQGNVPPTGAPLSAPQQPAAPMQQPGAPAK